MKAWYSKVRDTELIDGSVRADYVVTFETDNFELKRKVEKYLQGIMDEAEQTEPNCSEKPNNCDTCKNKGFEGCEQPCLGCGCCDDYEPITQTETQNSNLTFEKRTMRDCYNCKRYETEGECIECNYKPKDEPQTCDTCRFDDRYGDESICSTCARYYSDSYQPKYEPQTERSE